jgi:hypothetical protein
VAELIPTMTSLEDTTMEWVHQLEAADYQGKMAMAVQALRLMGPKKAKRFIDSLEAANAGTSEPRGSCGKRANNGPQPRAAKV